MPPHVAALVGSLRDESISRIALRETLATAASRGADTDLVDLRKLDLPVFDPDDENAGDADVVRRRLQAADAIVLGTPVYHGSYASPLKVAIDYSGFDEFENTTVGLLAVAGGSFPISALDHLRSVMRSLDAWVLPHQVAIPNASEVVEAGSIADDEVATRIETLGDQLVQYATIEPDPVSFEGEHNAGATPDR
ncbi:NADPH-dependent FMN reductase [Halanaeroarchaeum sulfurireducens]|uniref:NADPH-dependent FMN reductase n=1 Tax=Halanaeroarchaeum sulfurireducens TaxID=1604004 RepID=A0A0F7PEX8_9EURY|nr:NAD(P)H-dependent oxidoreductase [Halanaeroarchaeum sulfurireducens]AKH97888.1 NADPH-dependent FMN reductase [Halanaeroarchaeum sulfurireducens]ALG82282.1 NADPH-dependent FMN reductase [Halanaeroarchaeum sulfurireducens]